MDEERLFSDREITFLEYFVAICNLLIDIFLLGAGVYFMWWMWKL